MKYSKVLRCVSISNNNNLNLFKIGGYFKPKAVSSDLKRRDVVVVVPCGICPVLSGCKCVNSVPALRSSPVCVHIITIFNPCPH